MLQEGNIAIITRIVTIINTHSLPFFRVLQKNELIVDFFHDFSPPKEKSFLKTTETKQNKTKQNYKQLLLAHRRERRKISRSYELRVICSRVCGVYGANSTKGNI